MVPPFYFKQQMVQNGDSPVKRLTALFSNDCEASFEFEIILFK